MTPRPHSDGTPDHGGIGHFPDRKLQQNQQQPQQTPAQLEEWSGRASSETGIPSSDENITVHDFAPPGFNEGLDAQTKAIANLVEKQKELLESQGRLRKPRLFRSPNLHALNPPQLSPDSVDDMTQCRATSVSPPKTASDFNLNVAINLRTKH